MKSVRGNWRNALYIHCDETHCTAKNKKCCGAFLMTADADGVPLLISTNAFEAFAGESIEADECCGVMDKHTFEAVFALAIQWRLVSPTACPLQAFCNS